MEKLKFEYGFLDGSVTLELNRELFTEELAKEVLDFSSWEKDENNDVVTEACRKIAYILFVFASLNRYTLQGVLNNQDELEGIPLLDGSVGIKLINIDVFEFDEDEFKQVTILKE